MALGIVNDRGKTKNEGRKRGGRVDEEKRERK
jgi:hypothetical protein